MKRSFVSILTLGILLSMASFLPASTMAQMPSQFQLTLTSTTTGGISTGGGAQGYQILDTIGQPQVEAMQGGDFVLTPGFLSGSLTVSNLVLLYVNADNDSPETAENPVDTDLHIYVKDLFRRAHTGATNTDGVVLMALDGPTDDDSYLYRLDGGRIDDCENIFADYTCNGHYMMGYNVWRFSENFGVPATLTKFVVDSIQTYPSSQKIILALVGHGGGWSPNRLAGQPQQIVGQPDEIGGLLWDFHSAPGATTGYALSTTDLGDALKEVEMQTDRKIDLLYLDACLMGMWEVAYEVKDSVNYFLASESWSWTAFQYEQHLSAVTADATIEDIGRAWIQHETEYLREEFRVPYTYSLVDLAMVDELSEKIDWLASELTATLPAGKTQLVDVFFATDRFDSTQDKDDEGYVINGKDNYADLGELMQELETEFAGNNSLISAAQAVSTILESAIVENQWQNGVLPVDYGGIRWEWENPSGLSIYLPINLDHNDWRRNYYFQLRSSEEQTWDKFITAFWGTDTQAPSAPACPDPCGLPPAPLSVTNTSTFEIYLPLITR